MQNWTTLLSGVVGSTAYGLAHAGSDVDRLAMAAAPTVAFHGLNPPRDKTATRVSTDPDVTVHEAGKFAGLVLAGNPTVSELLWLEDYETRTDLGDELIGLRSRLVHAPGVKAAYLGYATQQFRRLSNSGSFPNVPRARMAKHGRHLARLLEQGTGLWRTGRLDIRVADPDAIRDFGERVAYDPSIGSDVLADAERVFATEPTVLPAQPDRAAAEDWVRRVRAEFYRDHEIPA